MSEPDMPLAREAPEGPWLDIGRLQAPEQAAAAFVGSKLSALGKQIDNFSAAISLIEAVENRRGRLATNWAWMAARDGAMSIYHFGLELEAISFRNCPDWAKGIDIKEVRKARRGFKEAFPKIRLVRHTVAHSAALFDTLEQADFNSVTGGKMPPGFASDNIIIRGPTLYNRTYIGTYEGTTVEYDLTWVTFDTLSAIASIAFKAFEKVDLHQRMRDQRTKFDELMRQARNARRSE